MPHATVSPMRARESDQRVHPSTARAHQWRPWGVATWVEWCGHHVEVILVPEGGGWYAEIPVLGVASYGRRDARDGSGEGGSLVSL